MRILIKEGEIDYSRPSLKKWLALQDKQADVVKAIDTRGDVAKHIVSYVSIALNLPEDEVGNLPWYETGAAYLSILRINVPKFEFPFLNTKLKNKKEIWDYEGRTFYVWAHLFAEEYGWTIEYVSNLDVDDAIALAQEIAVEDQLNKEWEWMTAEIAYQTKDGFKPLPRPDWMSYSKGTFEIPKVKIRKDFMPYGIVLGYQPDEPEGSTKAV